jgi:glutaredoxin-like protein
LEKLLDQDIESRIQDIFGELSEPIELLFFGQKEDHHSEQTLQLLEEVAALTDLISVTAHDLDSAKSLAAAHHVEYAPTIVLAAREGDQVVDYGVRIVGAPLGHEFTTLIHSMIAVSNRKKGLQGASKDYLDSLEEPVVLQVFSTPTCPYCPRAVILAHQLALGSPLVEAEMIEATSFPDLSYRYNVSSVPHTSINDGAGTVIGAVPESDLIHAIRQVLEEK